MADRKLPALIGAVAALLVGSIAWDAIRGTMPKQHSVAEAVPAATSADTFGAIHSPSPRPSSALSPAAEPSAAQATSQGTLGASGTAGLSYMEQLARADTRRRI